MDYEKKYKEAMEIGKECIAYCCDKTVREYFERMFPELLESKESKDESIRKELIEFVKSRGGFKQEYIAWLEKQGEHMPVEWSEEDKAKLANVIESEEHLLDLLRGFAKPEENEEYHECQCIRDIDWLKSLKDRILPQPKQENFQDFKELERNGKNDELTEFEKVYIKEYHHLDASDFMDWKLVEVRKEAKKLFEVARKQIAEGINTEEMSNTYFDFYKELNCSRETLLKVCQGYKQGIEDTIKKIMEG